MAAIRHLATPNDEITEVLRIAVEDACEHYIHMEIR
ncbi:MAG: hypothetical protein ACJ746_22625 [Bryobacteraceae bacterium]